MQVVYIGPVTEDIENSTAISQLDAKLPEPVKPENTPDVTQRKSQCCHLDKLWKKVALVGTLLAVVAAVVVIVILLTPNGDDDKVETRPFEVELRRFGTCGDIVKEARLDRATNINSYLSTGRGWGGGMMMDDMAMTASAEADMAPAPAPASSPASNKAGGGDTADFSGTNNQVDGVDESDIVKTDGENIFSIFECQLVIHKAYPPTSQDSNGPTRVDLCAAAPPGASGMVGTVPVGMNSTFRAQEALLGEGSLLILGEVTHALWTGPGIEAPGTTEPPNWELWTEDDLWRCPKDDCIKDDYMWTSGYKSVYPTDEAPSGSGATVSQPAPVLSTESASGSMLKGRRRLASMAYDDMYYNPDLCFCDYVGPQLRSFTSTAYQVWDVSDPTSPVLQSVAEMEGSFVTARMIENVAYMVLSSNYHITMYDVLSPAPVDERNILPLTRTYVVPSPGQTLEVDYGSFEPICACSVVGFIPDLAQSSLAIVASVSLRPGDPLKGQVLDTETIMGTWSYGGTSVYASLTSVFVAINNYMEAVDGDRWIYRPSTALIALDIADGQITYRSASQAPGFLLNQFSMDEHEDHFRVATTQRDAKGESSSGVYIFDNAMNLTGSLDGLAPTERIYSARFMGDRAYIVTFRQVDPLFVIDLTPTSPAVLGELKIPGFSEYIHPLNRTMLLGVGKHADPMTGRTEGLKLSLFDVADVSKPREVFNLQIGDEWSDSPALDNHKAFLYHPEQETLVLPVKLMSHREVLNDKDGRSYSEHYTSFVGVHVYKVRMGALGGEGDPGFELLAALDSTSAAQKTQLAEAQYSQWQCTAAQVERSLYVGDYLYTVSLSHLSAYTMTGGFDKLWSSPMFVTGVPGHELEWYLECLAGDYGYCGMDPREETCAFWSTDGYSVWSWGGY